MEKIAGEDLPDQIDDLIAMIPEDHYTRNGFGVRFNTLRIVTKFRDDVWSLIRAIQNNEDLPPSIYIPDLWHVASGRAKMFTKEDGQRLFYYSVFAKRVTDVLFKGEDDLNLDKPNVYPGHTRYLV